MNTTLEVQRKIIPPHTNAVRRYTLVLVLTERCNLSCVYCYEHQKDVHNMPLDTAKRIIIDTFQTTTYDEIEIQFHGGEPFAAYKTIKDICEWLWDNEWPKPYICFATTNGVLVHGKIREWITKNHDRFILALSLDGTPEMHNKNRNDSFEKIDTQLFRTLWPFQPIKMTVSPSTLENLSSGVIFLHNLGFKMTCNLAYGVDWSEDNYTVLSRELYFLVNFYLENPSIEPCPIVTMPIENIIHNANAQKWCGTGTNMSCIDKNGKKYPCHAFMPSTAGNSINVDDIFNDIKNADLLDNKCKTCSISSCCPTCYGLNYIENGNLASRGIHHCIFSKIRAKATVYMLSKMILNKDSGYSYINKKSNTDIFKNTDIFNMIHGIKAVNESIHV